MGGSRFKNESSIHSVSSRSVVRWCLQCISTDPLQSGGDGPVPEHTRVPGYEGDPRKVTSIPDNDKKGLADSDQLSGGSV